MKKTVIFQALTGAVLALAFIITPVQLLAAEKLVIVTSYPPDTTVTVGKAFTKAQEFSTVSMTCVDRYGFEMSVRTDQGPRPIRLPFASAITTADEARVELVRLAKQAREQLGA